MNTYDPLLDQNKEEWLGVSEFERIDAVREFHEKIDEDFEDDALSIHCSVHVIVENQLAEGVELIPETVAKLVRQGLNRHEAIHAIGAIISKDLYNIIRGEDVEFSPKKYRQKLEKITAKRWNKGQY